ncbi:MAG: sialidase family protein [Pseudomonadota bacterium]
MMKSAWLTPAALCAAAFACLVAGLSGALAETPVVTWQDPIEVASGEGHKGPWRQNDSDFRYVDDPSPAIGPDGEIGVVWVDQARHAVLFQVYDPDGARRFQTPVDVSRSPGIFSWLPRVAFADDGTDDVYVLWQEIVFSGGSHGGEIFFARSGDGGATFDTPVNLTNSLAGEGKGRLTPRRWNNGSLDLALGPGGALYAAWTEYEGNLWFARSDDRGATFGEALGIATFEDGGPARGPSLAVAPDGMIALAWTVGEDESADIRVATSVDGGDTFDRPVIAADTVGHSDAPKLAFDHNGVLHLAFAESAGGFYGRYRIAYARSMDGGREFEVPRSVPKPFDGTIASAAFPSLALGTNGTVMIMWERYPHYGGRPLGLGYSLLRDGGESFSEAAVVPGAADLDLGVNGSLQGLLMRKLAVDGDAVAVVNSTFKEGEASHVWLIIGDITGP